METISLLSLLQSVQYHWQESAKAYADYMTNGKQFQYAQQLRIHNSSANNLLKEHTELLPEELKEDAKAVIEHYTIWTAKWDRLKNELNPLPTDIFVFENEHRFPKAAAQNIERTLQELLRKKERSEDEN